MIKKLVNKIQRLDFTSDKVRVVNLYFHLT